MRRRLTSDGRRQRVIWKIIAATPTPAPVMIFQRGRYSCSPPYPHSDSDQARGSPRHCYQPLSPVYSRSRPSDLGVLDQRLDGQARLAIEYSSTIAAIDLGSGEWPLSGRLLPLSQLDHRMVGSFAGESMLCAHCGHGGCSIPAVQSADLGAQRGLAGLVATCWRDGASV